MRYRVQESSRSLALAASALLLCLADPAQAQFGNPGFMTPDSAAPAPAATAPNAADRLFVLLLGQGGLGEVELARLAEGKARSPQIKRFARRMIDDHGQANGRLAAAAQQAGLAVPKAPDVDQGRQQQRLQALADGGEFELEYLRGQVVDHQKAVQLLGWQLGAGQMPQLQRFAADTLPVVLDHLHELQELLTERTGAMPAMGMRRTLDARGESSADGLPPAETCINSPLIVDAAVQ